MAATPFVASLEQRLTNWFFEGSIDSVGARARGRHTAHWSRVMCLTGVDYFSTLAYQPSIAFLAAGALAPFATPVLIVLTLTREVLRLAEQDPARRPRVHVG